jgi:carbonic anhydrase
VRGDVFVKGLVENGGWERREAEEHFDQFSANFEVRDPVEFVVLEAQRLRERYPRVLVAPLFYRVGEGLLYQIMEP